MTRSQQSKRLLFASISFLTLLMLAPWVVDAQEDLTTAGPELALKGHCAVCLIEAKKWVKGTEEFEVEYDGHLYRFPSDKERSMFLANPGKYVPALHGDCTVCLANMGARMPGNLNIGRFYKGRVFFFPSENEAKLFAANPSEFANVDLALNGNCAVCLKMMGQNVSGKPEFTVHYEGFRYQFPSEKELEMFQANPTEFIATESPSIPPMPDPSIGPAAAIGSENLKMMTVSIEGRAGCAGCEHGVSPIGTPSELGLAVNTEDGYVFVVEEAHRLFPKLYEDRFDGQTLRVTGTLLKKEGKYAWLKPAKVELVH